jgi:hypothetical protein
LTDDFIEPFEVVRRKVRADQNIAPDSRHVEQLDKRYQAGLRWCKADASEALVVATAVT